MVKTNFKFKKLSKDSPNPSSNQTILSDILEAAGQASKIYLASDPDREGEAIA